MTDRDQRPAVDRERLEAWLDIALPDLGAAPLEIRYLAGGTSNIILLLNRGGETVVLRRPPLAMLPQSQKTILREATILKALATTDVPHPRLRGFCTDLDVMGTNFYVMERVAGWSGKLAEHDTLYEPPFNAMPFKYGLAFAMTDALVRLARVDYRAVGLEEYGKPEGFHARQVDRWRGQLESYSALYNYPGRALPGLDYVSDWLRANIPDATPAGIMHGDIGFPNAILDPSPPARVKALIDWELSTIGDPMMDLGGFANAMRDERYLDREPDHTTFDTRDFPTRQALARYYAAGTGRDVATLDYYLVLTLFKNACIIEYKVAQAEAGLLPADLGQFFARLAVARMAEAERIARISSL